MAPRYNLARRKAHELLAAADINEPPVDVEKLATFVMASIRREPFDGEVSGMVHRRADGNAVIGVNSKDLSTRQRFTIAHEIGHLVLHRNELLHVDHKFPLYRDARSSTSEHAAEIEANQFAAELLMPSAMVTHDMDSMHFDIESGDSVKVLADKYEVSQHAMTIRISTLRKSWI